LRQSEERFRTILETVESAFAIVKVKFDAEKVNGAFTVTAIQVVR